MGERQRRNRRQRSNAWDYCKYCPRDIMVKALEPHSDGRRKRVHRLGPETSLGTQLRLMG